MKITDKINFWGILKIQTTFSFFFCSLINFYWLQIVQNCSFRSTSDNYSTKMVDCQQKTLKWSRLLFHPKLLIFFYCVLKGKVLTFLIVGIAISRLWSMKCSEIFALMAKKRMKWENLILIEWFVNWLAGCFPFDPFCWTFHLVVFQPDATFFFCYLMDLRGRVNNTLSKVGIKWPDRDDGDNLPWIQMRRWWQYFQDEFQFQGLLN